MVLLLILAGLLLLALGGELLVRGSVNSALRRQCDVLFFRLLAIQQRRHAAGQQRHAMYHRGR